MVNLQWTVHQLTGLRVGDVILDGTGTCRRWHVPTRGDGTQEILKQPPRKVGLCSHKSQLCRLRIYEAWDEVNLWIFQGALCEDSCEGTGINDFAGCFWFVRVQQEKGSALPRKQQRGERSVALKPVILEGIADDFWTASKLEGEPAGATLYPNPDPVVKRIFLYNATLTKQPQTARSHRNTAVLEEYGRLPSPSLPVEEVIPIIPFQEILKNKKDWPCLVPAHLGRFLQEAKYGWDDQMLPAAALHLPPVKGLLGDSFAGTNTGLLRNPSLRPWASQQTTGVPLQSWQLLLQSSGPAAGSYIHRWQALKTHCEFSQTQNCLICVGVRVQTKVKIIIWKELTWLTACHWLWALVGLWLIEAAILLFPHGQNSEEEKVTVRRLFSVSVVLSRRQIKVKIDSSKQAASSTFWFIFRENDKKRKKKKELVSPQNMAKGYINTKVLWHVPNSLVFL